MSWKNVIGELVPMAGTLIGGPLGGAVANKVATALGLKDGASNDEIDSALATASPEVLAQIKADLNEHLEKMKSLDVDLERIASGDRDSARRRQVDMNDKTPAILATVVTIGFFSVLGYMMAKGIPEQGGEALLMLLGALSAAWGGIVQYYFGSSAGSKQKTKQMAKGGK